ncbi:MarR family winged helix-turn-helix transcriptional regulator [Umezawaea beigongshangensis]|uniref:MarR family winged helix-turn-helix transcriptional regulator n=1 Tax=Umezawaea beigongshangensis TaxID=2780383 RepID=UPI0018F14012|nr:MarR family transcriptional regulator [Umezawaea beigongshangensis]
MSVEARALTDVVTRLRRAPRTGVRTERPRESPPVAGVELLRALAERPPTKVGEPVSEPHLAPDTVSGLVGHLVDDGLVARDGDPADRRVALLPVTARGHEKRAARRVAHERRIGSAPGELPPDERADVVRALAALDHLVGHLRDTA